MFYVNKLDSNQVFKPRLRRIIEQYNHLAVSNLIKLKYLIKHQT